MISRSNRSEFRRAISSCSERKLTVKLVSACCRMSRVIRQPCISGNPGSQNTATVGGAAVLPITTRGRALATAALPIVLRNFRLDPDVDTDGTL